MSENYLILNGKRINLTEEQVKTLMSEEKKSPFARVDKLRNYFYITASGEIYETVEERYSCDDKRIAVANYCTDEAMLEQRALHETLNRLLWRYSEKHGGDNEWGVYTRHWYILKNELSETFQTDNDASKKRQGVVYFRDKETAQSAIEEIVKPFIAKNPEFVW